MIDNQRIQQQRLRAKVVQVIAFAALLLITYACKSKAPIVEPDPDPVLQKLSKDITGRLANKEVITFELHADNSPTTTLTEDKIDLHFGNRVNQYIPQEIKVIADSTFFLKKFGTTDKYLSKWEVNKLLLKEENTKTWFICGEKLDTSTFRLHVSFFSKEQKGPNASSYVLGQQLNTTTSNDLIAETDTEHQLIWLKIDGFYALNNTL